MREAALDFSSAAQSADLTQKLRLPRKMLVRGFQSAGPFFMVIIVVGVLVVKIIMRGRL